MYRLQSARDMYKIQSARGVYRLQSARDMYKIHSQQGVCTDYSQQGTRTEYSQHVWSANKPIWPVLIHLKYWSHFSTSKQPEHCIKTAALMLPLPTDATIKKKTNTCTGRRCPTYHWRHKLSKKMWIQASRHLILKLTQTAKRRQKNLNGERVIRQWVTDTCDSHSNRFTEL